MRKLKNEELPRLSVKEFKQVEKIPLVVVLDNVRSMNNIGSLFRTADAFLVEKIFLCGITATPPNKEIHKTALGSTESVDWQYIENTIDCITLLKSQGYKIYAIEQADESISLEEFNPDFNNKLAIIFGHEVKGVEEKVIPLVDGCLEIRQYGTKHSLNVSVSAGIVVWDLFRKFINIQNINKTS
jgi:tRNA G18 (ribose-2'-O)-methylase SpoU